MNKLPIDKVKERLLHVNVELLGEYINSKTPTMMYCLLCEQNFILTFTETMRRGHTNCPVRSGSGSKIRKMEELKQLVESYGQILISQEYPGSRGTIKIKCNICDDIYQKTIHNFRNNPKHTTCGNIILDRENPARIVDSNSE